MKSEPVIIESSGFQISRTVSVLKYPGQSQVTTIQDRPRFQISKTNSGFKYK